jgi:hypothetical protein
MDYKGAMGVPITFLDKYNPDQFEIIGKWQLQQVMKNSSDLILERKEIKELMAK